MIREEINNIFNKYREEKDDPIFNEYTYLVDPDEDGNYPIFFSFGNLLKDFSNKKIEHPDLLQDLIKMINNVMSQKNSEYDNLIKMEILSILNSDQILFFKNKFSERADELLEEIYKS